MSYPQRVSYLDPGLSFLYVLRGTLDLPPVVSLMNERPITLINRCSRTWASMTGGLGERFCDGCGRLVYNWSVLPPEERAQIKAQEPDACWLWPINVVRREGG